MLFDCAHSFQLKNDKSNAEEQLPTIFLTTLDILSKHRFAPSFPIMHKLTVSTTVSNASNRGIDDSPGDIPVVDGEFDCPLSNLALHSQGELGDCGGIVDESLGSCASPDRRRRATLALAST